MRASWSSVLGLLLLLLVTAEADAHRSRPPRRPYNQTWFPQYHVLKRSGVSQSEWCCRVANVWSWPLIASFVTSLGELSASQCGVGAVTQGSHETVVLVQCDAATALNVTRVIATAIAATDPSQPGRTIEANALVTVPPVVVSSVSTSGAVNATTLGNQVQSNAPVGLDAIDSRAFAHDGLYHYRATGQGITVWIIDTGTRPTHVEFQPPGRVVAYANTVDGGSPLDGFGHGTHVTGLVGGITYGVAKEATINVIKALDDSGSGSVYTVASALSIVQSQCQGQSDEVTGINLSLNGPASSTLDAAVASVRDLCHVRPLIVRVAAVTIECRSALRLPRATARTMRARTRPRASPASSPSGRSTTMA
jgi:hypothetical protein